MIEKMKKVTFLVTDSEYDRFVEGLRELGVVHVQQLQQGAGSGELQFAMESESRYKAALQSLAIYSKTYAATLPELSQSFTIPEGSLALCEHVESLQARENALLHTIDSLEKHIDALEPWGEFSQEEIRKLEEETGMKVHFFRCSSKFFSPEWTEKYFAIPITEWQKSTYFMTFSEELPSISAERIFLPEGTLNGYCTQLADTQLELQQVRQELVAIDSQHRQELQAGLVEAQNSISLEKVHLSDERVAGGMLRLLIGWTRTDRADDLQAWLDKENIFYEMEDPAFEDDVPIQITNNSFSRLFEPILRMYSLPDYKDIDPTVFFAPFFMLFFGLCLGDGGYGLIVLIGGLILAWKGKGETRDYGRLGAWLGGMTLLCGLATGTVFGIDLGQQDWTFLAPIKPYFLSDAGVGPIFGYTPMMVLSVIIGLVQVLLGMILKGCKAWKNYGFGYAIGTFSWVVALLSAIALFGLPACGVELPTFVLYLLYGIIVVSVVGIFLYNNPAAYKNPITGPLFNLGGGLWATYGMATGLLGDLLSYIRLFALGLTGGVLGGVFNSLALDMTSSFAWWYRWIPMVIVLLLGHGITFALSMISAFVHPMRLTFVEFFKNADYSGGGKAYTPFRKAVNE